MEWGWAFNATPVHLFIHDTDTIHTCRYVTRLSIEPIPFIQLLVWLSFSFVLLKNNKENNGVVREVPIHKNIHNSFCDFVCTSILNNGEKV